jgi:dGTPase
MYETQEGILKHCSPRNARLLGLLGERFLQKRQPSIEAQICNLADEVAYNNHDVDDGLRSGLLTLEQLQEISLFARHINEARREFPCIPERRLIHETIRRMIGTQVEDLLNESRRRINEAQLATLEDVHAAPMLIGFSAEMEEENRQLKRFLLEQLYRHYQVVRMTSKARRIIADLFSAFMDDPRLLPPQYQEMATAPGDDPMISDPKARAVADYIAGMTDRYAMREHHRLFAIGEI